MKLFDNIKSGIDKISVDSLKDKVEAIKETMPKKDKAEKSLKKRLKRLQIKRRRYPKDISSVQAAET